MHTRKLMHRQRLVFLSFLCGLVLGITIGLAIAGPEQQYPPPPVPSHTPTPTVQHTLCTNPLIPYGALPKGTRYSTVQDHIRQPRLVWKSIVYLKVPGADGRLWGDFKQAGKVKEVLLYAPKSQYCHP